jgi:putative ABC transport system permease protein
MLAVAILALGIGATTTMFSITRTVLLKPLLYRDPDRLVTALFRIPQFSKVYSTIPVNAQHFFLWRDHSRTLDEITLLRPDAGILGGAGHAEHVGGLQVWFNFFDMLGIAPAKGRSFARGENDPGHNGVVIISHDLWEERFGGRQDIIGQTIRLDGAPLKVVGVMPESTPILRGNQVSELERLPDHIRYWRPLVFSKDDLATPLGNENYLAIGRLKRGINPSQAAADLTALEKVIAKRYPEPVEFDPVVRPLRQAMSREVRAPLMILMSAVAAVMLIVCINLMNLMTVRAIAQRRQWGIRLALGASKRDLIAGAFLESLLVSLAGAVLGSLVAMWLLRLVRVSAPIDLPRINEIGIDPVAQGVAFGLAITSALVFGVWPAWRAASIDAQEALSSSGRSATQNRTGRRAGQLLVCAEVALSSLLLLTTGLLLRSFENIVAVNPGVDVHHLLSVRINLPPDKYREQARMFGFYDGLRQRVSAMPGVVAAGYVSDLPLSGEDNNNPATAADKPIPPIAQWPMTSYLFASSGYFRSAGIPLKEGRVFDRSDGASREVMISDNLARRLWPNQNAVGRPIRLYSNDKPFQIVGVVGAVHAASLTQSATMMIYFPDWLQTQSAMSLMVRTAGEPENLAEAIRRQIQKLEPEAAVPSIQTMREVVASSVSQQKFQLVLLVAFGVAALLLASLGIYGVLAFATRRRTAEIGVRMAMGARPANILSLTLRHGMTPVLGGIVLGLGAAAGCGRVLQTLLFHVRALDPVVYAASSLLLITVAMLACFLPARRASMLNPVEALRHE